MIVSHVEVHVEELSMEVALHELLPRLLGRLSFRILSYQGKDDLLRKLPDRLRGYRSWSRSGCRVLVLVDRDNDDCHELKRRMEQAAAQAGLVTRSAAGGRDYTVVNRVVIEELEAWYFGDWEAVRAAYRSVPATPPPRYRDPEAILGGTWEAFQRVLQRAGYFVGGLRKIEAARAIAPHWNIDANTSHSFRVLRDVLREMAGQGGGR